MSTPTPDRIGGASVLDRLNQPVTPLPDNWAPRMRTASEIRAQLPNRQRVGIAGPRGRSFPMPGEPR